MSWTTVSNHSVSWDISGIRDPQLLSAQNEILVSTRVKDRELVLLPPFFLNINCSCLEALIDQTIVVSHSTGSKELANEELMCSTSVLKLIS